MPTLIYPHWRDVPATAWRWPNFSAAEIACRGTGAIKINTEAMDKLQALRDRLGKPLVVRSAYRSPEHNHAVGGAPALICCGHVHQYRDTTHSGTRHTGHRQPRS
jgi:zinc D-Ala-D-Ala carboxypeptidase